MFLPDKRLLATLLGFLAAALLLVGLRLSGLDTQLLSTMWWLGILGLTLILVYDLSRSLPLLKVSCERHLSSSFALGSDTKIKIIFENPSDQKISLSLVDNYPEYLIAKDFPLEVELEPGHETFIEYGVLPIKRGEAVFGRVELRIQSVFQFWRLVARRGKSQAVKIYPNFMAVSKLNFLVYEQQLNHIGAHAIQRRGLGLDFKQLREFQRGDELRQVDWKASSRQHKLISREYQDERDQDVVFMLDTGRRMRASDDLLSHFDHCVNAMLLTSYIALMAGDAVGFMSFAGSNRWLSPIKGKNNINTLLNNLYDLHSTTSASDLPKAAENLMLRHRKRSLIILVTNIRDEDSMDIVQAVKLLSKKHIVMVACLREEALDTAGLNSDTGDDMTSQLKDFDSSLVYAGAQLYLEQRKKMMQTLRSVGVIVVDSVAEQMHLSLINEYMALKRAGRI